MNDFSDCYKYLEINYDTPFEDIQKRYKDKAKELHPDINPNINATEQFQKLKKTFQIKSQQFKRSKNHTRSSTPKK